MVLKSEYRDKAGEVIRWPILLLTPICMRLHGSGAPVVNMTSAYGGIRWTSGMNRQFQYEKSQSRLGKNLWEAPDLYIKNSPLLPLIKFRLR